MPTKFQHLGLTITDESDIREFYRDILKMDIQREFTLDRTLTRQIFHKDRDIKVVVGTIGDLSIELFITEEQHQARWDHICFEVDDRPALIEACQEKNYPVTLIERESFDIVFIRDKSGNLFEIKQALN